MFKVGRKRRADGRLKSTSDAALSFRDSLYSEKAAAMIETHLEATSPSTPSGSSPKDNAASSAFQFVDQSASSRREARRFVMRRSVWHRKLEQTKRLQGTIQTETPTNPQLAWRRKASSTPPTSLKSSAKAVPPKLTLDTKARCVLPYDPVRSTASPPSDPSPRTWLSAARKDPFDTLPVVIDDWDLVDLYHEKLRYMSGPQSMDHIKNMIWKHTSTSEVGFQATILAYCAQWRAKIFPTEEYVKSARNYVESLEPDLERYLQTSSDDDSTKAETFAIVRISQALQESRFGSQELSQKHMTNATTLLNQRGSLHPIAMTYLHYVYYTTLVASPVSAITVSYAEASMFTTFLQNVERLSILQRSHTWANKVPSRQKIFQSSSPLYKMLCTPPPPSPEEGESLRNRKWDILKGRQDQLQSVARMACLLFLNATLLDFRDSYANTAEYIRHLDEKIKQHGMEQYPSVEMLVWVLLEQEPVQLRNSERALFVGKMLRLTRRMSPEMRAWLNDVLLSYLALHGQNQQPEMGRWEEMLHRDMLSPLEQRPVSISVM